MLEIKTTSVISTFPSLELLIQDELEESSVCGAGAIIGKVASRRSLRAGSTMFPSNPDREFCTTMSLLISAEKSFDASSSFSISRYLKRSLADKEVESECDQTFDRFYNSHHIVVVLTTLICASYNNLHHGPITDKANTTDTKMNRSYLQTLEQFLHVSKRRCE